MKKTVFFEMEPFVRYLFPKITEVMFEYINSHTENHCLLMVFYGESRTKQKTWNEVDSDDLYIIKDWIAIEDDHAEISPKDNGGIHVNHKGTRIVNVILAQGDVDPNSWMIDVLLPTITYGFQAVFNSEGCTLSVHTMRGNEDEDPDAVYENNVLLKDIHKLLDEHLARWYKEHFFSHYRRNETEEEE